MRELMIAAAAGHRGWLGGVGPGGRRRRRSESGGPAGGLLPKGGRVDGVHIALAKGAYRAVFSYRQSPTDEVSSPTRGSLIILRAALLGLAGDHREATALWSDAEGEFPGFPLDSESHRALEELHGGLELVRDLLLDGLRRASAIRDAGAPQEPFAESAPAHCS